VMNDVQKMIFVDTRGFFLKRSVGEMSHLLSRAGTGTRATCGPAIWSLRRGRGSW
jgi:hypothetical protein